MVLSAIPFCTPAKEGAWLTLRQLWNERNNRTFRHEEVLVTRFVVTLEDSRLWVFAGAKDLGSLVDPTSRK